MGEAHKVSELDPSQIFMPTSENLHFASRLLDLKELMCDILPFKQQS